MHNKNAIIIFKKKKYRGRFYQLYIGKYLRNRFLERISYYLTKNLNDIYT